jgi:hypothetical protein
MKLLFVADPLESFKTYKDTTFAMMREAARRGHSSGPASRPTWCGGAAPAWWRAARGISLTAMPSDWFEVAAQAELALADVDAVLMRKDPPFDSEYFYATHLLGQAEREGARVFNAPAALRDHPRSWRSWSSRSTSRPRWSRAATTRRARLPCRAPRHHPQAAGRHGRDGHLPRRRRRPEPGQHHRDAQPRRCADADGAEVPARDRACW